MAAVTDLAIAGSGKIGFLQKWAVTEEATPHALGGSSSVGSLTAQAAAHSSGRSALLNDCDVTLTDSATWAGRVLSAPVTGQAVALTCESNLRFLNATKTAPPTGAYTAAASTFGSLDVAAVAGTAVSGKFSTLNAIAFDSSGNMFVTDKTTYMVHKYTPAGASWTLAASVGGSGTSTGKFAIAIGPGSLAIDSSGNVYVVDQGNNRIQKFTNALVYSAQVGSYGTGDGQFDAPSDITISSSGQVFVADAYNLRIQRFNTSLVFQAKFSVTGGTYVAGVAWSPLNSDLYVAIAPTTVGQLAFVKRYSTVGVASGHESPHVSRTQEGAFYYNGALSITGISVAPNGSVYAVDGYTFSVQRFDASLVWMGRIAGDYGIGPGQTWVPWSVTVTAAGVLYVTDTTQGRIVSYTVPAAYTVALSAAILSYVRLCDPTSIHAYSFTATDQQISFPGWTANVWQMLCDIAAIYRVEIYYSGGTVRVRDIGGRELDITNKSLPAFTPTSVASARAVEVVNQNVRAGDGLVMYDAADDGTIHTVAVGDALQVTLATTNHPVRLDQPAPGINGRYQVQDSTGLTVPTDTWINAGGYVRATVGETPGTIDLIVHGPTTALAGFTGPFSLAYNSNGVQFPALSITGSGVTTDPVVVTVGTGANVARVTQDVGTTLESPFVTSLGLAQDAGVWAACEYAFEMQVSFRVPRVSTLGFGDYAGRKFTFGGARWRVISATIDSAGVDITAAWHTTVAEVDAFWAAQTIATVDAAWGAKLLRDVIVEPITAGGS